MEGINIKGVMKTSMLDYPGKICATVFLSRCNFRCGFCHNPELVFDEVKEDVDMDEFMEFLDKKRKWLDGVCITGGEPSLHPGLKDFIKAVKAKGFLVKLDTNGTDPNLIEDLLKEKLIDYIAMDIKSSKENYDNVTSVKTNMDKIQKSIDIIKSSNIDNEFRTTIVPGLYDKEEAKKIGEWLKGCKKYYLQQFRNNDKTLSEEFQTLGHYHIPELHKFKEILENYIDEVEIRGAG